MKNNETWTSNQAEEYSSDMSPNDQWTPENDQKDDYYREDWANDDDVKGRKKRIRKKGRKARFLVDQLMYDQQAIATQQPVANAQQQQYPVQPQMFQPQLQFSYDNSSPKSNHILPELESVGVNHIPGIFDVVPRGQL